MDKSQVFIPCGQVYLFDDVYEFSPRDGYLEVFWQQVKLDCVQRLRSIEGGFCSGALGSFREEFMGEAGLWCGPCLMDLLKRNGVNYRNLTDWMAKDERRLILEGGLWREMVKFAPVLERLMGQLVHGFTEHICEVALAVTAHLEEICGRLLNSSLCRVATIGRGMSDYHKDFRSVHVVEMEDGKRFLFKPRSLAIDLRWREVLAILGEHTDIVLQAPLVIDCGEYGFVEFVEARPVSGIEGIKRFYERAGALACLLYVLDATDFHGENLIASGDWPVLVDVETVIGEAKYGLNLLRSGLFPHLLRGNGFDHAYDGLTHCVNGSKNLPILDGKAQSGRDWVVFIQAGFERCYRALMDMGRDTGCCARLTHLFEGCEVRDLRKATSYYMNVRRAIRQEHHMVSQEAFSGAIAAFENLNEQEKLAIESMQVPRLTKTVSALDVKGRLGMLTQRDMQAQLARMAVILSTRRAGDACGPAEPLAGVVYDPDVLKAYLYERTCGWIPRVHDFLNHQTSLPCLVVERSELHYYFASSNLFFLESVPGLIIALACCHRLIPNGLCEGAIRAFCTGLQQAAEEGLLRGLRFSLLEGVGGLLRALSMVWEITAFDCAEQAVENIVESILGRKLPTQADGDWYYGNEGLLIALGMLPERWQHGRVMDCIDNMVQTMGIDRFPGSLSEGGLGLSEDDSYRFGSAGAIDVLLEGGKVSAARELAAQVLQRAHKCAGAKLGIPAEYPMASFFYGEGGLLYGLYRALSPGEIPPLYDAQRLNRLFHREM